MKEQVINLAETIKHKYSLHAEAALSPKELVDEAKKDIVLAYKHHISDKAKEPVVQFVAQQYDEPWSKKFVELITELVAKVDDLSSTELFTRVNDLLRMISEYKNDPEKKVRNHIHDSVRINKKSDIQYREHVKSKFETAIKGLSGLLEKAALKLKAFAPEVPLAGGAVDPQRKELSSDKIRMFMYTPVAKFYGLNNLEIMTKILEDINLRQKLTTIINAIDRGHQPIDGPAMKTAVSELAELAKQRLATNEVFFEHGVEPATEMEPEELEIAEIARKRREQSAELAAQQEREKLLPLIKERDEQARLREIEKDRDRHIRSDSVLKLFDKLTLKGIYENR